MCAARGRCWAWSRGAGSARSLRPTCQCAEFQAGVFSDTAFPETYKLLKMDT